MILAFSLSGPGPETGVDTHKQTTKTTVMIQVAYAIPPTPSRNESFDVLGSSFEAS